MSRPIDGMTPDQGSGLQGPPVRVERWPTEIPLLVVVVLLALACWLLLLLSILGALYAILIGLFLMLTHLGFVAYLRGSAVRLGPEQFPELYHRVGELSRRIGLDPVPEAYVMQAGGALNALATAFLRSRMIVLFSDLLDACGDDEAARDMIIGHELGHIRAGHLRWRWFLFPAIFIPFLGTAYSRAREYTCDRYGAALCGDRRGALTGLAILAAGGKHGPLVNLQALAQQRGMLDTGWMTLGKWLGTHPPLSERIAALEPGLIPPGRASLRGPVRALLILGAVGLIPFLGGLALSVGFLPAFERAMEQARRDLEQAGGTVPPGWVESARSQVGTDFNAVATVAEEFRRRQGALPADETSLHEAWKELRKGQPVPVDPFDGYFYGYVVEDDHFYLWSSGPDREPETDDDIWFDSRDWYAPEP